MLLIVVGSFFIAGLLYWHQLKIFQDFNLKDFFNYNLLWRKQNVLFCPSGQSVSI